MMNNKDAIGRSVEKASLSKLLHNIEDRAGVGKVKEKVCRVTLYQDAHVDDKFISDTIPRTDVYAKMTMIRDLKTPKHGDLTLGELLKKKANEGVRKDRVMATHDEDMKQYFHNCEVHCVLCLRNPDNLHSIIQDIEISTMLTHHQKLDGESKRRIVSFIGGIDLTDGRYDTPHPIFRTLGTIHHDDFRQPCFHDASIVKGGPREPWHDIYCQLEGPRWRKQGEKDLLVPLRELHVIFIPPSPVTLPEDHETLNVQLFRSIDGGAAFGFPKNPKGAARSVLSAGIQMKYRLKRSKTLNQLRNPRVSEPPLRRSLHPRASAHTPPEGQLSLYGSGNSLIR
ncbi:hypothetical protein GOBAR_AA38352 [Gossypium barbadense]|uniref:Uncharacterized protein n=1 Tax=Gossypium barbadense TaxID=3634 RepID=A0A2P5VU44_GOSBA|nr:hypothetical protein GOBAR_AA38352 [Gossypium barbadense]